jgi:Protein of unknown function, DUF547
MNWVFAFWWITFGTLSAQAWTEDYARLLQKYVAPSGVRYAAWKANAADTKSLTAVSQAIAQTQPGLQGEALFAFRLNAYNAAVLSLVLERYPLKSVADVAPNFGFFSELKTTVAGQVVSLNQIEKELLLSTYPDARIHFAINCASKSCPPLSAVPFRAELLSTQLDGLTRDFLQKNPEALQVRGQAVSLSALFEWYTADFASGGGVLTFINRYLVTPLAPKVKLNYLPYNWNLNESP